MTRRHNFQTLSWFFDLWKRKLLDLDPPYQRRSVWNQSFKDYFVDTVLLSYPSPAIFLHENINEEGRSSYHVVDGKQRLTTLFDFVSDKFPVSDQSPVARPRGGYFSSLDSDTKKVIWGYQFLVEYIPTRDENIIDAIFDRLNRNVAKLTPQELRHARFDGVFMQRSEELAAWMETILPKNFPQIASRSRRQMKDIEFTSLLLLLIEEGPKSYAQADLDKAYSDRDDDWEKEEEIASEFKDGVNFMKEILDSAAGSRLVGSRLRNQADFYSLIGAIIMMKRGGVLPDAVTVGEKLADFVDRVESEEQRTHDVRLNQYYEAARSASNDRGPRETRINYLIELLSSR